MTDDKEETFERKKKRYKAVYRKEVPYRKIKGKENTLLQEPSGFRKKRVRKKKK